MSRAFFKYSISVFMCLLTLINVYSQDHAYASMMWYTQPAINFNDALPVGNGRFGAMVYGGAKREYLSVNEQTLWSGGPREWNNPGARSYLPLIREAALNGEYKKADSLAKFMQGPFTESYMPMADISIVYPTVTDSQAYRRMLDLDKAIVSTSFKSGENRYERSVFSSFPDQVLVIHHKSSRKRSVSFYITLSSKIRHRVQVQAKELVLQGKCPKHVEPAYRWQLKPEQAIQYADNQGGEGMNFEVRLRIVLSGGVLKDSAGGLVVRNADEATVIVSGATSYNGYQRSPGREGIDPSIKAKKDIDAASVQTYAALYKRHVADYQPIFRRVHYDLGQSKYSHLPSDERLKLMKTTTDPELVATIAQYGRYILIAGSRPGGQPVNLKGIWNERMRPEYSSNWCIDHDAQMFYYAVETANLSEMHKPFLEFIKGIADNGKKTAAINYGMSGWCAHHNADMWRCSGASGDYGEGNPHWANWNMAGPWLSAHFYEHYLFTGDKQFLASEAWPVMKGAAEFCLDWLTDDGNGFLVSVPSVSPENTFITEKGDTAQVSVNTTSDIALMKQLFRNCIKTAAELDIDDPFVKRLENALKRLQPYRIGSKGQLLEWTSGEWRSMDPAHRHLSHMYPVFPGDEISPTATPDLGEAAKKALSLREKTNCSWGFAWKAGCWARLHEADSAWQTWQYQLQYVDPRSTTSIDNYGLFPNFFNSDGRDVIMNGNGCATAVLTEMLLQSHTGYLEWLPALPKQFSSGAVRGLRARGGFEVDITWMQQRPLFATVQSQNGTACRFISNHSVTVYDGTKKVPVQIVDKNRYTFNTEKGKRYKLVFNTEPNQ